MNDFVIQFYENSGTVKFFNYFGLTTEQNYNELINFNEKRFIIDILQDDKRKQFLSAFYLEIAEKKIQCCKNFFRERWQMLFQVHPPEQTTEEFVKALIGSNKIDILRYTEEYIIEVAEKFIQSKLR